MGGGGGGGGGGRFGGGAGVSELFLLCIQLRDGGEGGLQYMIFFTKNPNQKYFFLGGGGEAGAGVSELFLLCIQI